MDTASKTTHHRNTLHFDIEGDTATPYSADCICGWSSGGYATWDEAEEAAAEHEEENRQCKLVALEDLRPGDELDQGTFDGTSAGTNERTVTVHLLGGSRYTESAGAQVRVWNTSI